MENNVLLATFENQLSAFEALADIKTKYSGENYVITQAAVVRKEDDKLSFKDGLLELSEVRWELFLAEQ